MRRYLLSLLVLLFAVWLGIKIKADPGYALFAYQHWTVEMPLWLVGLAILALYVVFYCIARLLHNTSMIGVTLKRWSKSRKRQSSMKKTRRGLLLLAEGKWSLAEKYLVNGVNDNSGLINYLGAAKAAQELGADDRRDRYLAKAQQSTPHSEVALGLVEAELQLSHHQLDPCLTTLRHLQRIDPNHPHVLKLLQQLYSELHDWNNLLLLLPQLRKRKIVSDKVLAELYVNTYHHLLMSGDANEIWQTIPKHLQREPKLVIPYVRFLLLQQRNDDAYLLLRDTLKKQWSDDLIDLYATIKTSYADKQLATAESWLKSEPQNPHLLYCLGMLAKQNQLWGKAREYFHASISLKANKQVYYEYGKLLEELKDKDGALEVYRKGLSC